MDDPLAALAQRLATSRTIAFVGAGCSVAANYPTWDELLHRLGERAGIPDPTGDTTDPRWRAEVYASELSRLMPFNSAIEDVMRTAEPGTPQALHHELAGLPFRRFVTTNYDLLIEQACDQLRAEREGRELKPAERCRSLNGRNQKSYAEFLAKLAADADERIVLHLHGMLTDDVTLTQGDYDSQYLQESMLLRIFAMFATSTVVFIGCSLHDRDLMELVRRTAFHGESWTRHFAFLPGNRRGEKEHLERSYGIRPLFYEVEGDDHSDLERQLVRLKELVDHRVPVPPAERASGNRLPVCTGRSHALERAVESVKDHARYANSGSATFDGLGKVASARLLRCIAHDYRRLPATHFVHVIYLSARRIGVFPMDSKRPRRVLDAVMGEMVSTLGYERITAGLEDEETILSIRHVLGGDSKEKSKRALVIVEGLPEVEEFADDERRRFLRLLVSDLPEGSVAVHRDTCSLEHPEGEEPLHQTLDPADFDEDENWANDRFEQQIAALTATPDPSAECLVLALLCVLANPEPCERLVTMSSLARDELEVALARLAAQGLIETERPPVSIVDGDEPDHRAPDGGLGRVDVTAPVRSHVLTRPAEDGGAPLLDALASAIDHLLHWAEARFSNLAGWEDSISELDELRSELANLLAIFEASAWLGERRPLTVDQEDRRLWLGADLGFVLLAMGRWAEARCIIDYIHQHHEACSEPMTLLREAMILRARLFVHAGGAHVDEAIAAANEALSTPEGERPAPGHVTYAPARVTPERQRARAELRLGAAYLAKGDWNAASDHLQTVASGKFDSEEADAREDESLRIVADACGYLGEGLLGQLAQGNRDSPAGWEALFATLDRGWNAILSLGNRRLTGHHARLRGEALYVRKNLRAARRCFAYALLVAFEFRDRFLEAHARLGLARCERDLGEARAAGQLFQELNQLDMARRARDASLDFPHPVRAGGWRRTCPSVVALVGPPGAGKSFAAHVGRGTLAAWGFDTSTVELETKWQGEPDRVSSGAEELARWLRLPREGEPGRQVHFAELLTTDPSVLCEALSVAPNGPELLPQVLCVHVTAPPQTLRRRNGQRRSRQLSNELADRLIERSERPKRAERWDTYFDLRGGAYSLISSPEDSPEGFERMLLERLKLSFASGEVLRETGSLVSEGGAMGMPLRS